MKFPTLEQIEDYINNHSLVKGCFHWTKTHSLPGFFEVPVYDVLVFIYHESRRSDLLIRANSMAYSFFLSLFPTLILLFTLLPYFQTYIFSYLPAGAGYYEVMEEQIQQLMPGGAGDSLFEFIHDITSNPRFGLLSFGFILAIYFSSNGMITLMKSFEKIDQVKTFKSRGGIKSRGIAILLTFLLGLLLVVSVILIILGNHIIDFLSEYIKLDFFAKYSLYAVKWFVIVGLFYTSIAIIYRYGSSMYRKFPYFTTGTTLACILSILTSVLFSFYVDNFGAYNKFYGSIGTIIVIMIWIQLNAFILLVGFELNASIAVNRDLKNRIVEIDFADIEEHKLIKEIIKPVITDKESEQLEQPEVSKAVEKSSTEENSDK